MQRLRLGRPPAPRAAAQHAGAPPALLLHPAQDGGPLPPGQLLLGALEGPLRLEAGAQRRLRLPPRALLAVPVLRRPLLEEPAPSEKLSVSQGGSSEHYSEGRGTPEPSEKARLSHFPTGMEAEIKIGTPTKMFITGCDPDAPMDTASPILASHDS